MNLEEKVKKLAKGTEGLFNKSILTREDTDQLQLIRANFKNEVNEGMRVLYLETKIKYILLEKEYLEQISKNRMGEKSGDKK